MIYIDPPYGIKFGSNWQVSTRKREVKDGKSEDLTRQPEQVRAFRDTWNLGIHSYLSYLRDRLVVARDLLTETGSIFVQINSENSHIIACLMDEVFGSENFVANIIFRKKSLPLGAKHLETMHDHILFYAKDKDHLKYRKLYEENDVSQISSHGPYALFPDESWKKIDPSEFRSKSHLQGTKYYRLFSLIAPSYSSQTDYDLEFEGETFSPPSNGAWIVDKSKLRLLASIGRIQREGKSLSYRLFYDDFPYKKITNFWLETAISYEKIFVVQTSPQIVERCLLMTTDPGDLVLDPTCGSGTTAYVAEQWGRRWVTIDTSRVALALARTRLMAAKYLYYLLADSPEGVAKEAELSGKMPPSYKTEEDIKKGFVYKRVPHITLKSIANNPDIKEGMSREEIDAAIARHADKEVLYDQPYEDNKRIRVTGPFTVESLSPHRVIATDEELPSSKIEGQKESGPGQFESLILENLKKAGVQNTIKNERLKFDRLEPYAGLWIHAEGEYTETPSPPPSPARGGEDRKSSGKKGDADKAVTRRVAICIGPEHGTVGPQLVKEAAKEAVQGIGFDLLVVCGFAFDPHVSEEAKRYGKLTVLMARMNPDLAMGDELLKKTGAGNLFMVFGEPDVVIHREKEQPERKGRPKKGQPQGVAPTEEKIVVEIRGVDVYDPTSGQIRSSSTDDIACWFIDTEYNGESFFVRHAYFTGADEPYEKLKRALRADVDESAWASIYSTKSRPFPIPKTNKIAIKVINHYGDEVLKVYEVN
jgi:adenine-specific DNA-methyltransferase